MFKRNLVSCEECKLLLNKADASIVEVKYLELGLNENYLNYYCPAHRKPYLKEFRSTRGRTYWREMVVDKNGVPVGYEPIKSPSI